jgi:DNA-binding MarR family transcriptional regulator
MSSSSAADPVCPALDEDLGFTLGVVFRAYVKAANALFKDIPAGPRGYQVVAAAVNNEANSQGALAQRLGVDRTVMTYLVDDLEAIGLVERRADPADRRNRHIVATLHGRRLWADTEKRLRHLEDQLLGPLSVAERATFRTMLRRLAARANELDPVDNPCQVVEDLEPDQTVRLETPARRRSRQRRAVTT